jgi:hypothetical protein
VGAAVNTFFGCDELIEVGSASEDVNRTGIGGSPYLGDMGNVGLAVPQAPTTLPTNRYLFRLAVVSIPSGNAIIVRGLRQFLTLYAEYSAVEGAVVPVSRLIQEPTFSFFDGNVSWHLRHKQQRSNQETFDPNQPVGASPNVDGRDPALLYSAINPNYVAPAHGIPPGEAVGSLGTFYDIRFPWVATDWGLALYVEGPGDVVFYASVYQTDATSRFVNESSILVPADTPGITAEDAFVSSFAATARYGRVGGSIIYEPAPCCAAESKGNL